jgi:hypothetical protein
VGDGRQVKRESQATAEFVNQTSTIRFQTGNDDYTSLMETPTRRDDLDNFSFDEFVSFLFEPDVPTKSESEDPWHWNIESEIVARMVCAYYVKLFRQPEFLLTRFTKRQIEQGFWAILNHSNNCSLSEIIGDSNLPFALREEIIRSMADLFEELFASEPLDTSVFMWWDALCYDWHSGNRIRERGGEDEKLQDVFF